MTTLTNPFFYLFILSVIISFTVVVCIMRKIRVINDGKTFMQQQHVAKIDQIRKDQTLIVDAIRHEATEHEAERHKQWIDSEREMSKILTGMSTLLDVSNKVGWVESSKILNKLEEMDALIKGNSKK